MPITAFSASLCIEIISVALIEPNFAQYSNIEDVLLRTVMPDNAVDFFECRKWVEIQSVGDWGDGTVAPKGSLAYHNAMAATGLSNGRKLLL
ncbi:hypothetical protein P886_4730 [Alteromonadaceae bacterium 2753L.S.0a.02]|nr:hypothetical protein P886_4730 [Alteromonadaceae bacterium 2753L.S.0a.02]